VTDRIAEQVSFDLKKNLSSQILSILLCSSNNKYRFGACKCYTTDPWRM